MYRLVRKALFRADAESVHERVLHGLHVASRLPPARALLTRFAGSPDPRLVVSLFGRAFATPLALAAGLDKNGIAVPALDALGFAFVEVGTVTLHPQIGNQKPRVFRLPDDQAIINRMGFPGAGADAVVANLRHAARSAVALNIGPNKDRIGHAAEDCLAIIERVFATDPIYIVVNVSSPNTAKLRDLQGKAALDRLLREMRDGRSAAATQVPLLVKIAPDLTDAELDDVLQVVTDLDLAGIVATNTTLARPPTLRGALRGEQGGLSGRPLTDRATAMVARIHAQTSGSLPIIAAGGVFTGKDVLDKIGAGASMVQTYTGFVYRGPGMARAVNREMATIMERQGVASLDKIRGTGYRAP